MTGPTRRGTGSGLIAPWIGYTPDMATFHGVIVCFLVLLLFVVFGLLFCAALGACGLGVWWTLANALRAVGVRDPARRHSILCFLFPPALVAYLAWAAVTLADHFVPVAGR